jgi:threonyl-tRNA synthetase
VKFLTVTDKYSDFAGELAARFTEAGLRAGTDLRNEKIGYKIREARNARDSYIVVVGEKEIETGLLPVRSSKAGELGTFTEAELIEKLRLEIETKTI